MSATTAAQQYFDPTDPEPRCDICEEPARCCDNWACPGNEWNGETGNHVVCEERQKEDEEDDGEEMLRKMENAADQAAAGVPLADREY